MRVCQIGDCCTWQCIYVGNGAKYDESYYCSQEILYAVSISVKIVTFDSPQRSHQRINSC